MRGKCESCEFFEPYPVGVNGTYDGTYDGVCTVRSPAGETWPKRYKVAGCGEHREREVELPVTTEVHHCICGEAVDIKVQGGKVIDWNGHGRCPVGTKGIV